MRKDIEKFIKLTGSNLLHVSFELFEFEHQDTQSIIRDYRLPTIEIIYGHANTFRRTASDTDVENDLLTLLTPIKELDTKVFRRIYDVMDVDLARRHLIDGFCIKGMESAGFGSFTPVRKLFLKQKEMTPDLALIPYGGVGTPEQVRDYMDLGAEIVAVGTLLALSAEGPLDAKTKMVAIQKQSTDLSKFQHQVGGVDRKQNALQFDPYKGPDDDNGTIGLVRGIHGKQDGHVFLGHGIDHVTEILTCQQVVDNLTNQLS
jgi:NAD(P)H-dependent flavin oxidoreductase YrpB (nitropropane dioxygenase family)